jgi:hypothetical protein
MTDKEQNAEIKRKIAEIVAEAQRLANESEAILALMEGRPPVLRLIQGGKK